MTASGVVSHPPPQSFLSQNDGSPALPARHDRRQSVVFVSRFALASQREDEHRIEFGHVAIECDVAA